MILLFNSSYFKYKARREDAECVTKSHGVNAFCVVPFASLNIHLAQWAHTIDGIHLIINTKLATSPHKRSFVELPTSTS